MIRTAKTRALAALVAMSLVSVGMLAETPPASAVDTFTWVIDANRLTVTEAQEDCFLCSGEDEPYIAVVGYRSRFGVRGSTNAVFRGGLRELGDADDGDTLTIPDSQGRMAFPSVTRVSAEQIAAGQSPEVMGTITVAMESDATPFSAVHDQFVRLASVAKQEIASVVENTTMSDFIGATMDGLKRQQLADRFEAAIGRIRSRMQVSFWDGLGLWLRSFSDPDDRIAFRISAFVAVDSSLASIVETEVAKVLPAGTGVGGALRTRSTSVRYNGDDADYQVASSIFATT